MIIYKLLQQCLSKNQSIKLNVFNKYQTEIEPSATLTIVGSGEEEELLRKKIAKQKK